ncbi:unnamed protein product [Rodentolepis nana]|uniref:Mediator of RNA polymerase II transcription subunit 13 n=1 Tax=Rodentolepis nana TaxID=102285 RepID=A0A0R3TCW1_RODNA|nr:unnamed protein product [Rodentolepis nana]
MLLWSNNIKPPVKARIATLQQLLPRLGDKIPVGPTSGLDPSGLVSAAAAAGGIPPTGKLPTVDAAWDLPIPSELTQRQIQLMLQEANRSQCSAFNNSAEHWSALLKNNVIKLEEDEMEGENEKVVEEIDKGEETGGEKETGIDNAEAEIIPRPIKRMKIEEGAEDVALQQKSEKRSLSSSDEDDFPTTEEINTLYSLMYLANSMTAKQRRQYEAIHRKAFNYLIYKKQHPEETLKDPFYEVDPSIFKRQQSTNSNSESGGRKDSASEGSTGKEKNPNGDEKECQKLENEQNHQSQQQQQQQQNPEDATVADLLSVAANDAGLGADQLPDDDFSLFTDDDIFAQLNGTGDDLDIALFHNPPGSANGGAEGGLSSNSAPVVSEPDATSTENDIQHQDSILQMKQETTTSTSTGQHLQQGTHCGPATMANTPSSNIPNEVSQKPSAPTKYVKSLKAILIKPLPQPKWPLRELNSSMSAKQARSNFCALINFDYINIIDSVSGLGRLDGPWWNSLLPETDALPSPPDSPSPPCPMDKLLPPTPCICVDKRKDAMSADLAKFCLTQPVVVIRGMTNALRMDLAFFSTKALVDANPNQRVKIHTQSPNANGTKTKLPDAPSPTEANLAELSPWYLESPRSLSTIQRYANYQASSFKVAVKDEKQGEKSTASRMLPNLKSEMVQR